MARQFEFLFLLRVTLTEEWNAESKKAMLVALGNCSWTALTMVKAPALWLRYWLAMVGNRILETHRGARSESSSM